jgi:hypothetical protein
MPTHNYAGHGKPCPDVPALPLAIEVAKATIPVPGSLNVSGPCTVKSTVPPLPEVRVRLWI